MLRNHPKAVRLARDENPGFRSAGEFLERDEFLLDKDGESHTSAAQNRALSAIGKNAVTNELIGGRIHGLCSFGICCHTKNS
jgi:hypothetical protein